MTAESGSWVARLGRGLAKSASKLTTDITAAFQNRRVDAQTLDELEEILIAADLGPSAAAKLVDALREKKFPPETGERALREALAQAAANILRPVAVPLELDPGLKPQVILVAGVNGTGKTTTIGKLAQLYGNEGRKIVLAACDTFRAAAIDQLKIWGERSGAHVVAGEPGADPAALAFDALARARDEGADLLLIDTAGRLHNKADLMAELQKIARVLKKLDAEAPHNVLLVLDATTGQNAIMQTQVFQEMVEVTGLVLTKLDGSAKGGVLIALAEKFGIPVHAVGVGEGADDLRPFDAEAFARALMGLEP